MDRFPEGHSIVVTRDIVAWQTCAADPFMDSLRQ